MVRVTQAGREQEKKESLLFSSILHSGRISSRTRDLGFINHLKSLFNGYVYIKSSTFLAVALCYRSLQSTACLLFLSVGMEGGP